MTGTGPTGPGGVLRYWLYLRAVRAYARTRKHHEVLDFIAAVPQPDRAGDATPGTSGRS